MIAAFATLVIVILIAFWFSKRLKIPRRASSRRIAGKSSPLPFALAPEVGERMSAAEMLARLPPLRERSAQWDVILSELNPSDDPEIQRLLIEIRGPHLFVPHVGLSVIEDGCQRVLSASPQASALDALRQATRGQQPFVY